MSQKPLSVNQLRELINKGEAKDPLVFLESVMNGQDPRRFSRIYRLVCDINDFSDGEIDPSDWAEVVDIVVNDFKYAPVSMNESMNAVKTLAEYLYPKRKQVDLNGGDGARADVGNNPLTAEEIELFKEKFNDEF